VGPFIVSCWIVLFRDKVIREQRGIGELGILRKKEEIAEIGKKGFF